MRILHVSDLHFHQPWFDWVIKIAPNYDGVCLTGDLIDGFSMSVSVEHQSEVINRWLAGLQFPIFICSGNHDWSPDKRPSLAGTSFLHCKNPAVRTDGTDELFMGHRFVCAAWGEPVDKISGIEPVVLLSHVPPAETRLAVCDAGDLGEAEVRYLADSFPQHSIVLSGHVHKPDAWFERINDTCCFNPGSCSFVSKIPNHIRLDLSQGQATFCGESKPDDEGVIVQKLW